jgi:signal transduction histidine kinase/CheY-like chemotaxis protein
MGVPLRLLLVEDDKDDAFLVTRHLRLAGFDLDVHQVDCATDFLAALKDKAWDLILSDYQMPGFSGFEALELLRHSEIDIPFLLVSGAIGEHLAVEAMRHGARDYLLKDNLARLVPAIRRELVEASERRARRRAETRQKTLERALQAVLLGTSTRVGEEFFQSLVEALATSVGFKGALVARLDEEGTTSTVLASYGACANMGDGGRAVPLKDTVVSEIISSGNAIVQEGGFQKYSDHGILEREGIQSLLGLRLSGSDGLPSGVLLVCDDKPIEEPALTRDLLSIFASRAGSELSRLQAEAQSLESERKLLTSQKFEALGTLAGGIAHDINNILTSIWGHAQILEAHDPDSGSSDSIQGILGGCRRARELAKQILLFGRRQEPSRRAVPLLCLVDEALGLLAGSLPPGVRFERRFPEVQPFVSGDSGQLHQVVVNLCTNAVHAMEDRTGAVVVSIQAESTWVELAVEDSGVGMTPEVRSRIFEPFFTTRGLESGTGLGLSVVHGIVLNHGGTIDVRSEPGKGSSFSVRLPLSTGGDLGDSSGSEAPGFEEESRRILVVDDEPAVTEVLEHLLEHLGWGSVATNHVQEGLRIFQRSHGELSGVVCDLSMPGMDGITFARRLNDIDPRVPVLLSSGYEGIDPGSNPTDNVVGFLPKPFQAATLSSMLSKNMRRRTV